MFDMNELSYNNTKYNNCDKVGRMVDERSALLARVSRISVVMVWVTGALGLGLVAGYVGVWLTPGAVESLVRKSVLPDGTPFVLDGFAMTAGFVIGLVPLALGLWGLGNAFMLFRGYCGGGVFAPAAGRRLRRMGFALLLMPVVSLATSGLASVLFTMHNPPGQRAFALSISSNHLIIAVVGALLITVGWVTALAARIDEENRQFV